MCSVVNDEEMLARETAGSDVAKKLNNMIANMSLVTLEQQHQIVFCLNGEGAACMGKTYLKRYRCWMSGALVDLHEKMEKDKTKRRGRKLKFVSGMFGSVWFDVDLTGMVDESTLELKAKTTRVCYMGELEGGEIRIMLDATFEDSF